MGSCIVFKKDGSLMMMHVESKSSHLILVDSTTYDEVSYWIGHYEQKIDKSSEKKVFQIAYLERPKQEDIEAAILALDPFPVQLIK